MPLGGPHVVSVYKKYTLGSKGIWERIRRLLAVDPNRSTGVPLIPQYRNPAPGSNDPAEYTDATTTPAADLADNPYWKRDVRRNYPRMSVVTQSDVVGLLTVGSASSPSPLLAAGEEGTKMIVAAKEVGEKGLAEFFQSGGSKALAGVLNEGGLPPMPVSAKLKDYQLLEGAHIGFPKAYPIRSFS